MNIETETIPPPAIMAPAGTRASFLAALAAGADAIYCGLKHFSARMEAKNFSINELSHLTHLAHSKGTRVYVTINSLLKPGELNEAGSLIEQLEKRVNPDALIIQDLALVKLAKQIGFSGELHLSTLANVSFSKALKLVQANLGINRIVIPRELNIDEIKTLAGACPKGMGLEMFVHGALCFGVSGRCYWSSYFGGKSGLRGRCVQPCRRLYAQRGSPKRYFSCQDLSLDILAKVLISVPEIRAWKIEGRKKGPHYVYNTVKAYKLLRDKGSDPENWSMAKKEALDLLSRSLGRPGTHYYFLPQRPQNPIRINSQTGSGFLMGRAKSAGQRPYFRPREDLFPGDTLRLGYEDESWHSIYRMTTYVPKKGRMDLKPFSGKKAAKGTPVFLIDRREEALDRRISKLEEELTNLPDMTEISTTAPSVNIRLPGRSRKRILATEIHVYRQPHREHSRDQTGFWLSSETCENVTGTMGSKLWWWLPPVIWPDGEKELPELIDFILKRNARNIVLNAPWQMALFPNPKGITLWAGPFCNVTNGLAISVLASMGFAGVIVSPELGKEDYLELPGQSPLPLGIVISGNWPLCVSRILSGDVQTERLFTSPKREQAWVKKYGSEFWVYPNWKVDLKSKKGLLQKAGYSLFVNLIEPVPRGVKLKKRPGLWNWDLNLL